MNGRIKQEEGYPNGFQGAVGGPVPGQERVGLVGGRSTNAPGLNALHELFHQVYPEQKNPLTVTAVVKFWLGGPDPLDYISMYENPGNPELCVPPHWHYISQGLSDLHGDGRLHPESGPDRPSGFGFELTFRLVRKRGETTPPTWPATVMQQLSKYVFNSNNLLLPGDHVSWHGPLDNQGGKICQILMARDPVLSATYATPHGEITFVQIVGVTTDELQAAQHWNGLGVLELLKSAACSGSWLVTDMERTQSIMEINPSIAENIQRGIEREGSNLSGVSAKCWWVQLSDNKSISKYREKKEDLSDDEEEDIKPVIKSERLSPCEELNKSQENKINSIYGLNLFFNMEAGNVLLLAIKGRVMHGRHFTFKSILSHSAVTLLPPSVTGSFVSDKTPYAMQGPWLQVLLPDELAERMATEFQVLSNPSQLQLPKTFSWPEYKLSITIVNE